MRDLSPIALERQRVNDAIRLFFRTRGYVEVETPLIVQSPDLSSNLTPFETTVIEPDGAKHPAALITSPEFSMKKLLGSGLEKIFCLGKVFRNVEAFDETHNPEFTMVEWYEQGKDYQAGMDDTEALVRAVCDAFGKTLPAFQKIRIRDLFLEHVGLDLDRTGPEDWRTRCAELGIHTDPSDSESDLFYRLFLAKVDPLLTAKDAAPTFVYDYPKCQAALSRLTPDGRYGERFELYINGVEFCNAFTELTNAAEQRMRFEEDQAERARLGKTAFPIDEELLRLLPSVRQPTFGNALGVDRLHMLATRKTRIEDVLLFPAKQLFS